MGRHPTYEMEDVLRASTALFRAEGFHRVSIEQLLSATGLNRFALYEKFGGKEGLFYETLDFYHSVIIREELLGPLFEEGTSLDSILGMLGTMREINLDEELSSGCLIVNANIELGASDERVAAAANSVMSTFGEATGAALSAATRRGEIGLSRPHEDRVSHIVIMIQAFFSLAYISREAADQLIGRLIDEVGGWRALAPARERVGAAG